MCVQLTAYNTYATLLYTNPLFIGFPGYSNVLKEIVCENIGYMQKSLKTFCFGGFLHVSNLRTAIILYIEMR